jgi:peroxiredoxin
MEMPSMEALYRRLRHRDFVMLAVAEDEGGADAVGPFVRELGLTFPVLLDPEASLAPRYGATGYPETFIIDRNGQVVNHTIGPAEWDSEQMVAYFEQLLAPPLDVERAGR